MEARTLKPLRGVVLLGMLLTLAAAAVSCTDASRTLPIRRVFKVRLWPDQAPVGDGTFESVPTELEIHLPEPEKATGAAFVVCPGGGYVRHVMDSEGWPIAEWLNANGIAAVLLLYRLPEGRPEVPLLDAQRAIRTTRAKAQEWGIDPGRIGIMGFSAGGHVASTAGTHFDAGHADNSDPVERASSRPDLMILVYPVVTMGERSHPGSKRKLLGPNPSAELVEKFSNEAQVTDRTPPAFLTHAMDDRVVPPANSRNFVTAMREHGVPVEYLELSSGGHGFNGCKGYLWEEWKAQSLRWLRRRGVLPSEP
jgi:acetyl esterase/lipase